MGRRWRSNKGSGGSDLGPLVFIGFVAFMFIFRFAADHPAVFAVFLIGFAALTLYFLWLRLIPVKPRSIESRPAVPEPKPLSPAVIQSLSKTPSKPAPARTHAPTRTEAPDALPYRTRGTLLSRGEHALYDVLVDVAAPGHIVLAKVRLADVVEVTARGSERMSWLARVIQKHVDFVVCEEKTLRILLVIELDDRSHADPDRQERDSFVDDVLAAAGIPIHHVRAQRAYDVEELRELLATFSATAIEGRMRSSR